MADFQPEQQFGRYRVSDVLGRGTFGTVYLGFDDELHRKVAIKVPHRECIEHERDIEQYIAEARTVASLEHDGIASVFDVGRTDDGLCYVVSRFIDGESLAARIRNQPPEIQQAIDMVAAVAETLDYVHQQLVVHRDIKPGNLLISVDNKVYVTDFGLALRDHQLREGADISGTPKYMSPEQARGESHLVDGRSDIFSLGIVLYKLITGVDAFSGPDMASILHNITDADPIPPRDINELVPVGLQRICLKALSKPIGQRYSKASALADDLRRVSIDEETAISIPARSHESSTQIRSSSEALIGVSPRGLRSFNVGDATFFTKLLPGPFDADGLPESIRFWKTLVECRDSAETFRVGVIYGPSGCGKSSLMKAGLLPTLDDDIETIFLEATPDRTEQHLATRLDSAGLQASSTGLTESLQQFRNNRDSDGKLLIVIDQFEQWLHSVVDPGQSVLAAALRQCDGKRLQCVLLVRDDFWLAVSRFMACLDIDLAQNQNMRLVDLFDLIHARRVLAEFGAGYGRLADSMSKLTAEQNEFLDESIRGLQQNEKIIPVRLALFAELVKGRPWTMASLQQLGGVEGVGTRFLEECFDTSMAPAEQRVHRNAVYSTLTELLPDHGTDIKGAMKSYSELLTASGYADHPDQFRSLVRILDTNLRLITPTDPMGLSLEEASEHSGLRFYQLTHDFLVPAIRQCVTEAERSTRRGRAELLLRDLSAAWSKRPDKRSRPSWFEWLQIQLLTKRQQWSQQQKEVVSAATKRFAFGSIILLALAVITGAAVYEYSGTSKASSLVNQLVTAKVQDVAPILTSLKNYQRWSLPDLQAIRDNPETPRQTRLFASLALLPARPNQAAYLQQQLIDCQPPEQPLVLDALQSQGEINIDILWQALENESQEPTARLNASMALARLDQPKPSNIERWSHVLPFVSQQLVVSSTYNRQAYPAILDSALPLNKMLGPILSEFTRNDSKDGVQKVVALQLQIDLLATEPRQLADLILNADVADVVQALPTLEAHRSEVVPVYKEAMSIGFEDTLTTDEWVARAHRQSMAAGLLLRSRLTQGVWDVLRQSRQSDARTYLIHLLKPLSVDPDLLMARLHKEKNNGIRNAILLAMGEYTREEFTNPAVVTEFVQSMFVNDPNASVHSAAQWLLGRWHGVDFVKEIQLADLDATDGISDTASWRPDESGMTMIRVSSVGNTISDCEISSTEIQSHHIQKLIPEYQFESEFAESDEAAAFSVSWADAIEFCQRQTLAVGLNESDQCYEKADTDGSFILKTNYRQLRGYRLPTQAEWEVALLGDSEALFEFGNDVDMILHYEWLQREDQESKVPAQKKPNRLGFFDMNGNLGEWCADLTHQSEQRPVRGATRFTVLKDLAETPTMAGEIVPTIRWRSYGYRVARSIPNSNK